MKQKTKIFLTAIISVILTFALTSTIFLYAGGFFDRQQKQNSLATPALLSEVKAHLDALYMGEIDEEKLYHYAAKGMAESTGDKYTMYYTPSEFEEYMNATTGEYVGVGIVISATVETNEIIVVLPYEDAPGFKAGILPGDIILAIDSTAVNGDMLDEAASLLRGENTENPAGTSVTVTIKRGDAQPFDATLVREQIHLKTVSSKMIEGDIGYMRIISFDSDSDEELEEQLDALEKEGMKKLILDLRDNGGGDFMTAQRIAGKFLNEGELVVYTQNKDGKRRDYYAEGKMSDCEIILLINENSASASEVLTGALMGNDRIVSSVGTKTFGKGITQNIYGLKNGGGMSITVDRYYTPQGECIHEKGIEPQVSVSLGENEGIPSTALTYEQDLQLQKAVEMFR